MMDLKNTVINDILCFISTARHSLDAEYVINTVHAFYDFDKIKKAKDFLCKLCKTQSVRRRSEDKIKAEIEDILKLFENSCDNGDTLPNFVAEKYNSLPPISGFECVANRIIILTNEIEVLQDELKKFRETKDTYSKGIEECMNLKLDVADIKNMLMSFQKQSESLKVENKVENKYDSLLPPGFLRPFGDSSKNEKIGSSYSDIARNCRPLSYSMGSSSPQRGINHPKSYGTTHQRGNTQNYGRRANDIIGNIQVSSAGGFRGVKLQNQRPMDIFIGRCELDATAEQAIAHCKEHCNIDAIACTELPTRSIYYKSFKMTVTLEDRNVLLDPMVWPEGIIVRKFFKTHVSLNHQLPNSNLISVNLNQEQS